MNYRLTIEGSASQLAMILASLPDGVAISAPDAPAPQPAPIAGVSRPAPIPPMPANPSGDEDGDDNGPVNPNAPAVDATGLPWDERIHAKTKTTKADGSWTGRRGGPKGAELAAIEAELRARGAAAPQPVAQPAPAPAPIPPIPQPMALPPVPMQGLNPPPPMPAPAPAPAPIPMPDPAPQPMPQPAPAPVAQAAPEPLQTAIAAASGPLDFAQFMQHISAQMLKVDGAGVPLIHAEYLAGVANEIGTAFGVGLSSITDIANDARMITYAMQCLQRDGRW